MYYDDIKLTSGAVILAGILLAATDTQAGYRSESPQFELEFEKSSIEASKQPNRTNGPALLGNHVHSSLNAR
ncbi:hypothetical protein IVG45_21815 [Methylomonas sp. LL1]|uniref:hypothetical protein n=1 Tax=Methylomonas sp. LL1 TaxID=2785785 RepID=UPI0018C3C199|nr:hypothetical protein [Methylomonas sp. LL1]QPK63402.1 hypothetical protein IVG45_21815 [Methylomonas sp. LL1]CAG1020449.1 hypothetical protein MTYM_00275 [Methylococcales bacterium]